MEFYLINQTSKLSDDIHELAQKEINARSTMWSREGKLRNHLHLYYIKQYFLYVRGLFAPSGHSFQDLIMATFQILWQHCETNTAMQPGKNCSLHVTHL